MANRWWILAVAAGQVWGAVPAGSAYAGRQVFVAQQCIECHSINGQGGKTAPDLGKHIARDYTPTMMVALMWNHAPDMWAGMEKAGIAKPQLSDRAAADLFAYFVAMRFFDQPGDAARGKQDFAELHCAECHGITKSNAAGAPPVVQWEALGDPLSLAAQMWDHGAKMHQEFGKRKLQWIQLTGQQLTDILVYLQNLPQTRNKVGQLEIGGMGDGAELFQEKGCAGCHTGANSLQNKLHNQTLTEIAAAMWNHQPLMKQPPPELTQDQMRQILTYVWAGQYFGAEGNAARGRKVFAEKHCAECHNNPSSGAPDLAKLNHTYTDITMVSVLWDHGPHMLDSMRQKGIAWPRFEAGQMGDLIAYLNSLH